MSEDTNPQAGFPRIRIGGELKEGRPEFLGVIMVDAWEDGTYGTQWHLGVKPVGRMDGAKLATFVLNSKTGMFSTWYKPSDYKSSKMGAALTGMAAIPDFADVDVGFGELNGKVAWWLQRDLTFGKDKAGKPMVAEGVLVPIRAATAEEQMFAQDALNGTATGGPAAAIAEPDYTDEQVALLISLYEGKTPAEAKKAIASNKSVAAEIRGAVFGGSALTYLEQHGHIELVDGRVVSLDESEAA